MKKLKMLGAVVMGVVALSAVVAATASAALPEFTPGAAGTTFTGTSGTGTLTSAGGTIVCEHDKVVGELTKTTKKNGTATVTFTGCSAFGFIGAKSLGAAEGEIVTKVNLELCYINKAKKEVGLLTEVEPSTPVHVEVLGKLIVIKGDAVGVITPVGKKTSKFTISYKQKERKQEPAGCEGKTETLLAVENEKGEPAIAGEATTEETTFKTEQTLEA